MGSGGLNHQKTFGGSTLEGIFDADDGLKPCVNYTVDILAKNSEGQGPWNSYDDPFIIYFDGEFCIYLIPTSKCLLYK